MPRIFNALKDNDEPYIIDIIRHQSECGACYVDINTAMFDEDELEYMLRLVDMVSEYSSCGIMLDSPKPEVLIQCMEMMAGSKGRKIILNSVTEDERFDVLIRAAIKHGAGLVVLPMTSGHIPSSAHERLNSSKRIVEKILAMGFVPTDIYIDIIVKSLISNPNAAIVAMDTLELIKGNIHGVKTICGLSNISYGLPERERINAAFLAMCMSKGLDSTIMDVTNEPIKQTITSANALLGSDELCLNYINSCRDI